KAAEPIGRLSFCFPLLERASTILSVYEILTKDLSSSTSVKLGKNLVRIWVEFDKKMVLFLWVLQKAIFGRFFGFLNFFETKKN
ncbi:MAG: hypothetical protein IJK99_03485, partial [Bacteroidales bacterium]|nr:hypothetical protein [Bacteroidales bacterium]